MNMRWKAPGLDHISSAVARGISFHFTQANHVLPVPSADVSQ